MIDLEQVFRSIINFKNAEGNMTISQRDLMKNFKAMQEYIPKAPEDKAYHVLYHRIYDFVKDCSGDKPELPSYEFLKNHFENIDGNEAVLAVIEKIKVQQPYIGQDYRALLKLHKEDQNVLQLERILSNASKISSVGMVVGHGSKKINIKGVKDAISYFARESKDLMKDMTGVKIEGQIVSGEEAKEVMGEYEKAEKDPSDSIGINTWLSQLDKTTNGLKNTELMFVAGFTGHCKTTFALNMAYRAIYGGWNTGYITLEMSFDEIRRHLYILHASNPKFRDTMPEYAHLVGKITYNNVRYGRLTPEEKKFYFEVCRDFDANFNKDSESYGRCFIWQPEMVNTTTSDVEFKLRQWQQELEMSGRKFDFCVLDYVSLLSAEQRQRVSDKNETYNNIISTLKRICLTFNNGMGTRICSPFQINRAGYREAMQNEGRYYLTALSNFHAAERDGDLIVSLFKFDDDNNNNRLKICGLKNRRNKNCSPFDACINFETGFIYNFPDQVEQNNDIEILPNIA